MRLHVRLALPLFAIAGAVMLAGTIGTILLVRSTFGAAVEESGRQLTRITENILRGRGRGLDKKAAALAVRPVSPEDLVRRLRREELDMLLVIKVEDGSILAASGLEPETDDLRALTSTPYAEPLVIATEGGPVIAGFAKAKAGRAMVVGELLGYEFAGALKGFLRTEVDITGPNGGMATTVDPKKPEPRSHLARLVLLSPGGKETTVTVHIPAAGLYEARKTALTFTIGGGLILLLLALGFYAYAVLRVTRPIRELGVATERIASGELDASLPANAPAELGNLVRQFEGMGKTLKETQDKLVHSAKLSSVGSLVAGISHELNNPLLGLLGHAEYLAGKMKPGKAGKEELEIIIKEAQRMKRILADLRGFVRPSETSRARIELNGLVEEVGSLIRHDAVKANVAVEFELSEEPIQLDASPDQLRQVILNLALNALQAMTPAGIGQLTIRTTLADGKAKIEIEDNGPGIDPEHLKRITEPFFSTKPGRMGLGMAICQEAISKHGGTLKLKSELKQGTIVTVELPVTST